MILSSDVPGWLKSLRLHKYAALFSTMTYDEMMSLTEQQLEAQVCVLICALNDISHHLQYSNCVKLTKILCSLSVFRMML